MNHKDLSNVGDYDDDLRVWEHPVSVGLFYSPFFRGQQILKETRMSSTVSFYIWNRTEPN